jgi:nucleoside-diphosphate-sugar epimerase
VRALVHLPEVPLIDDGARRVDLVAARDVAAMVVAARHMPARGGPTAFHLSSCPALTIREILALAAEAAGTTPRLQPVPLAHALASNARAAGAGAPPPFPPALLAYAMFERTYDSALARQHLGFAPTDARRALLEAVRLSA